MEDQYEIPYSWEALMIRARQQIERELTNSSEQPAKDRAFLDDMRRG
jgi:hypothetical protein